MKKLFSIFAIFFLFAFTIPTRTVSTTSTTIASGDDGYVIIHTGANATYTLGTVSSGFTCNIVNHGTGNITFSGNIRTANAQNITVLTYYSSEINPGVVGNSIRLLYDGSVWRSIN